MNELMDEKTKKELKRVLGKLPARVRLVYFTQENACPACRQQQRILESLAQITDKVVLEVNDLIKDAKKAAQYGIDKIPATAVIGKQDHGLRFYGLTAGYEFQSLIETILMVATEKTDLSAELEDLIKDIKQPVHIEVMTTLTCPYCPRAVHAAQQLAMINDRIKADMVESTEFPQLAQRYNVTNTPKTMINEKYSFVGALPADRVYLEVLRAINPEEYKRIEAAIREAHGHRHVRPAEQDHIYDIIIIGGGTAAMSAAIYAVRKALDVLLVAKDLGGQISYTATVENYLGMSYIEGREMVEQFVMHMEQFPIAENLGANALEVTRQKGRFVVATEDKKKFLGKCIIYCAGKEYRRLGVPGEERFMGHGVAYCATCDAPLYMNKIVAIVGGGNSAFTAARDLLSFARKIHIIHRRDAFTADAALVKDVKTSDKVIIHTNTVVSKILGNETVTGIRLQPLDGKEHEDVEVNGVFLEIGLSPNTEPVRDLVKLNERREIAVTRDNATSVPGFYAAGDVTDLPQKQIIIAAGEGAKAALSAYNYLVENKLVVHKTVDDIWQQ